MNPDAPAALEHQAAAPRQRIFHKVGVVLCAELSLASLGLVMDIFRMGNQLPGVHRFVLTRVSEDGSPVSHQDGELRVDGNVSLLAGMDMVVVPSLWTEGAKAVAGRPGLVEALRELPPHVRVVTLCTGAYLLAASGRLDGHKATTHWMLAQGLQQAYPAVEVDARENLVVQGPLICSGGSLAGIDACLHAVKLVAGPDTARALARLLVTDMKRGPQTLFMPTYSRTKHADREVHALQDFIDKRYAQPLTLDEMAGRIHVSVRTLQRRFLAATGMTPMQYLQVVRIERGKGLLVSERLPVAEIAAMVGYQDRVSFGRLFKSTVGMTPAAYRQKHQ
jgi:transcriptional regulator GlxA family with amidase domain